MHFRKLAARAAIVAVLATSGLVAGAQALPERAPVVQSTVSEETGPTILGGCIRLYASGPEWHVDSDHHTVGIDYTKDPEIDAQGFLTFWTIEKNPVISASADPDETLTALGVNAGISNGTHLVRIRLYKDGINGNDGSPLDLNNPVHWSRVSGPYNNLWITLVHDL